MEREFDVVVIGAGPSGEIAAGRLAERGGKRIAIVESHLVGGECSFYVWLKFIGVSEQRREQIGLPGSLHAEATDRLAVAA